MTYGLQINDLNEVAIFKVTDQTIRLAAVLDVTVPSSGTTAVSVPSATTTNTIVSLENGATATVTSAGVVTLNSSSYATTAEYNTKLKVYLL